MAALSPEERAEEVRRDHATRSVWARKGWKTRRENAGLPPGPVERSKPVQVRQRDLELAQSLAPDAKPAEAIRTAMDGLRLAMASGVVAWTDGKWELGAGRLLDAMPEPPPASTLLTVGGASWGILEREKGGGGV